MFFRRQKNRKRFGSLLNSRGFLSPTKAPNASGKTSAGTSPKGSLTVECAWLLPLFFLAMVTLISFLRIYELQTAQLVRLCEQAKQAGVLAYGTKKQEVTLPAVSFYESPIAVIPLPRVRLYNSVTVHTWVGYQGNGSAGDGSGASVMVYVTEHGGVYHTDDACHYLDLSIRQVTADQTEGLRNQDGGKYYPCEQCAKEGDGAGLVYITDTGNRYHTQAGCSSLKRTVRLMKKEEAAHLPLCKKCAGKGSEKG